MVEKRGSASAEGSVAGGNLVSSQVWQSPLSGSHRPLPGRPEAWGARMDQGTLVEMQIDNGNRLLDQLVEEGVPVAAAAWLKESDDGQWFLYIATPLVDEGGATKEAYRHVNLVIRRLPEPPRVHPLEIKL